jgi:hypothetical protein
MSAANATRERESIRCQLTAAKCGRKRLTRDLAGAVLLSNGANVNQVGVHLDAEQSEFVKQLVHCDLVALELELHCCTSRNHSRAAGREIKER